MIPAYVKRALMFNFKKQLQEGDTIKISTFDVEDNVLGKWQKARVIHDFKLLFSYVTKVQAWRPDMCILSNGLKLVPFDELSAIEQPFYVGT